jgi:hypothetical protein
MSLSNGLLKKLFQFSDSGAVLVEYAIGLQNTAPDLLAVVALGAKPKRDFHVLFWIMGYAVKKLHLVIKRVSDPTAQQ